MQAIRHSRYGGPDVLRLVDAARPSLGPRDVLVAIEASGVTRGDLRVRAADFPGIAWLPGRLVTGLFGPRHAVPGTTFAGRVVEIGAEVTRFAVGDSVFGIVDHGAHAELLAIREDGALAKRPAGLDAAEAATLPYGAATARTFLIDLADVKPGERVAVVGASGEVGRFAVALARHLGAEVTAIASRDFDGLLALGADRVIDRRSEDPFAEPVDSGPRGQPRTGRYDVVFDTSTVDHFRRARPALATRGRYLTLHLGVRILFEVIRTRLFGGPRAHFGVSLPDAAAMEDVARLASQGAFRPVVARRFPLAEVRAAHELVEAARAPGSVVLELSARTFEDVADVRAASPVSRRGVGPR
jgi:NADPH:quinone reductase-like Zn-dependent oxidoreductase